MNSGTKTIVLTIVLSLLAAIIFPVENGDNYE